MKRLHLLIVLATCSAMAAAQEDHELLVDGQLRTRGEYNNGAWRPRLEGEEAATFVNERARLSIGYRHEKLELKLSAQHTGVWGQDNIGDRNGHVAMNEAWARLRFGAGNFFAQIGRQQLAYDDERLLGANDWDVAAYSHDALRLGYERAENKVHLIAAFNQASENNRGQYYNGPMPYKSMVALWYHYDAPTLPLGASLMVVNIGREIGISGFGRTNFMQTFGTHLTYQPRGLDAAASFYYQTGRNTSGYSISAWMVSAHADCDVLPTLRIGAGYDRMNGNNAGSTNTVNAFEPLFGSYHRFFGSMDYFTGQMLSGIQDIQLRAKTTVTPAVRLHLDYHYFLTTRNVLGFSKEIGHEVDLKFSTQVMDDVELTGGYAFMLGTETMDVIRSGSHKSWQDWGWLSLNINTRLFSTKW